MVRCKQDMLPVKHLAQKILKIMAVNYCWRQLARRLGWMAPACHENEGATLHHWACKHSLQYDARPDGRFGQRVGTWNLVSLIGKGGRL